MKTTLTPTEKVKLLQLISGLEKEYQDFVLHDMDTQLDIIDNDMDAEEIAMMISSNISHGYTPSMLISGPSYKESQASKTISLRLAEFQIAGLKQKAKLSGIGYQAIINMLISHYLRGSIKLEI